MAIVKYSAWLVLALAWQACMAGDLFSQHPGFAAYFAAHPPSHQRPSAHERALLQRFRPRLWVGADQDGPMGFYADYIDHGTLYDGRGQVLSRHVDRAVLNAHKHDPEVVFDHRPGPYPVHPTVIARIDHASLPCTPAFTYLTYHFVFRDSGLPAGLAFWQAWPLALVADVDDWHQLDHYTAASVVLDGNEQPVALLLQQHNDQRSFVFGRDIPLPRDQRVPLTAALRSNELYPRDDGRQRYRTVRFMTPDSLRYLVTGHDKPVFTAHDITRAARAIDYTLTFLPHDDAFYVFAGRLGARRWLPGRDGPPGAIYHTLPMFLNRAVQLVAFHWREHDTRQMQALVDFLHASQAAGHAATRGAAFQTLCRRFLQALPDRRPASPPPSARTKR